MSDVGTTSAFYAARPTLIIDGHQDANLSSGIMSLLLEETTAGLSHCELTFGNWGTANGGADFLYLDRRIFDFGKELGVLLGEGDTAVTLFNGRITALEAHYPQQRPPEIVILAEDRLQDLRMTRRTRTFEDVTDADVVRQIAAQHSLPAEIDIDGPSYRVLAQLNQSDLAFLRERARAIDAELWIADGKLFAQARSRRQANEITLTYGQGLIEFSILADLAHQRTAVRIGGWNVDAKEEILAEAGESAIQPELNGHLGGGAILQEALGTRDEQIVHLAPFTLQEARALADAHYRSRARMFVTGQGTAEGDGRLRVGTKVSIEGVGALFEGSYFISEIQHTFDATNGYRTQFGVERPGIGR